MGGCCYTWTWDCFLLFPAFCAVNQLPESRTSILSRKRGNKYIYFPNWWTICLTEKKQMMKPHGVKTRELNANTLFTCRKPSCHLTSVPTTEQEKQNGGRGGFKDSFEPASPRFPKGFLWVDPGGLSLTITYIICINIYRSEPLR